MEGTKSHDDISKNRQNQSFLNLYYPTMLLNKIGKAHLGLYEKTSTMSSSWRKNSDNYIFPEFAP